MACMDDPSRLQRQHNRGFHAIHMLRRYRSDHDMRAIRLNVELLLKRLGTPHERAPGLWMRPWHSAAARRKNNDSDLLRGYDRNVSLSIGGRDAVRDAAKRHVRRNIVVVRKNVGVRIAPCELGQGLRCTTVRQETDLLSDQRSRKSNQKLIAVSTQVDHIPRGR